MYQTGQEKTFQRNMHGGHFKSVCPLISPANLLPVEGIFEKSCKDEKQDKFHCEQFFLIFKFQASKTIMLQ